MKGSMTTPHHGTMHMPYAMVWLHAKHIDVILLLIAIIAFFAVAIAMTSGSGISLAPIGNYPYVHP